MSTAVERITAAYRRIAEANRPEIWITLATAAVSLEIAAEIDAKVAAGEDLPLAGYVVAVKDNIDALGFPTTAACRDYAFAPEGDATSVARLRAAGAVIIGKTNLDQFATGLVGTRSPYGAVRNALDPDLVSGGSSSGSAVAVALGIVDAALGTDTAGSGRVPAALNGIVGIKATVGVIPADGVVPACVDYDCVTVFARELDTAVTVAKTMIGDAPLDPRSRVWPSDVPLAAPQSLKLAVPTEGNLVALTTHYDEAFKASIAQIHQLGIETVEVDISDALDAALLLYDGALVAERFDAVGEFLAKDPESADPTVAAIVAGGATPSAHQFASDLQDLAEARNRLLRQFDETGAAGLLIPTTTEHPTIEAVNADPIAINRRMGTFTNFMNLLDLAGVAVPAGTTESGKPFGVTVVVDRFHDQVAIDVAAAVLGVDSPAFVDDGIELAVFGAHLRGQPLHWQLNGARYFGEIETADSYRLVALATTPPKPGVLKVSKGGAAIPGELYRLSPAALGRFLAALPAPMSLGAVQLSDGRSVVGFGCAFDAGLEGADITEYGGWRGYLDAQA